MRIQACLCGWWTPAREMEAGGIDKSILPKGKKPIATKEQGFDLILQEWYNEASNTTQIK